MFANISGREPSTCYGFARLPASRISIRLDLCVSFDSLPEQDLLLFTLYSHTAMCFCNSLVTLLGVASCPLLTVSSLFPAD